jgi:hypothetical protein
MDKDYLILKHAPASRSSGEWYAGVAPSSGFNRGRVSASYV